MGQSVVLIHIATMDISHATAVDEEISNGLTKVKNLQQNNELIKSEFYITTMTVCLTMNSRVDIRGFAAWFEQVQESKKEESWNIKNNAGFYNCVILKHTNNDCNVAVKIFSNGSLHMTGARSIQKAVEYGKKVADILQEYNTSSSYCVETFRIVLINGCFKVNLPFEHCFCLKTLCNLCTDNAYPNVVCALNTDHHPGMRIKLKQDDIGMSKTSNILVFNSGSILINAFLTGKELEGAVVFIMGLISEAYKNILKECVQHKIKGSRKRAREFDYSQYLNL